MAALPENDRITGPYIADEGQTDFPADFPLIRVDALRVRRQRGELRETLSGLAVAAIDVGPTSFTCRLSDPCEAGDVVLVFSDLAPARARAHTPGGAVRTETLEADANELQAQLQEQRRDLARAVMVEIGDTPPTPEEIKILAGGLEGVIVQAGAAGAAAGAGAVAPVAEAVSAAVALRAATYVHLLDFVPIALWAGLKTPASVADDMTPYILLAAAALQASNVGGGEIRCDGLFLRIRTQLVLPDGISLWGGDICPGEIRTYNFGNRAPQLITDPGIPAEDMIVLGNQCLITGFTIRPFNLVTPFPNNAVATAALAGFAKTAIRCGTIDGNVRGYDSGARNNLIIGYNLPFNGMETERVIFEGNLYDCNGGPRTRGIYDWGHIQNNNGRNILFTHQPFESAALSRRPLAGYNMDQATDWGQCFRVVNLGYKVGIAVNTCDNPSILHFGIDNEYDPTWGPGQDTRGLKFTGTVRLGSVVDGMIAAKTHGIEQDILPAFNDAIHYTNVRIGGCNYTSYLLKGGNATFVNCHSYLADTPLPNKRVHVSLGDDMGKVVFVGSTFENQYDVDPGLPVRAREVTIVGCVFKDITDQYFYNTQLQGAVYVRGRDGAFQDRAAIILENGEALTGMETGQAWTIIADNFGRMVFANLSTGEEVLTMGADPLDGWITTRFIRATKGFERLSNEGAVVNMVDRDISPDFPPGGPYTVGNAQRGRTMRWNGAAELVLNLSNAATPGVTIEFIQGGTGKILFQPQAGANLLALNTHARSAGQNAVVRAICHSNPGGSAALWYLTGDRVA